MTIEAEAVYVALGSNLGDRHGCLAFARARLAMLPHTTTEAVTPVEETVPLGPVSQGPFLNQMVLLRTTLSPGELLRHCHAIEDAAGRERSVRWGPRTLDLDIVRFGERRIDEPALSVPHPQLVNRPFWQRQLAELAKVAGEGTA